LSTGELDDIQTPSIVPVDLNCIIHKNARTLHTWFNQTGNKNKSEEYGSIAQNMLTSIQEV